MRANFSPRFLGQTPERLIKWRNGHPKVENHSSVTVDTFNNPIFVGYPSGKDKTAVSVCAQRAAWCLAGLTRNISFKSSRSNFLAQFVRIINPCWEQGATVPVSGGARLKIENTTPCHTANGRPETLSSGAAPQIARGMRPEIPDWS